MAADPPVEKFSVREFAALVVLAAHGRELGNPEFVALAGFPLTGAARHRLVDLGLIDSRKVGRAYAHRLTEDGWRRCPQIFATGRPGRAGSAGGALFALLDGVQQALTTRRLSHADFFGPTTDPARPDSRPDSPPEQAPAAGPEAGMEEGGVAVVPRQRGGARDPIADGIRAAYARLARAPGAWVGLADLRDELPGFSRGQVDVGLRQLSFVPGVSLIPVAALAALQPRDRRAAIMLGDYPAHALRIESA